LTVLIAEKNLMQDKPNLKIDWASHAAAKYACLNWHYSKCLPVGKLVKVGAWEGGKFIGVVIFGRGATYRLLEKYELSQDQGCELVRIALTKHTVTVTKIMALAIKFLTKSCPELKMVVSFADPAQGHHGGIYQGGNWIYTGLSDQGGSLEYFYKDKWTHARSMKEAWGSVGKDIAQQKNTLTRKPSRKHRYLMPLDKEISAKIVPLAKPYPKRVKEQDSEYPLELGGVTPTHTLHKL